MTNTISRDRINMLDFLDMIGEGAARGDALDAVHYNTRITTIELRPVGFVVTVSVPLVGTSITRWAMFSEIATDGVTVATLVCDIHTALTGHLTTKKMADILDAEYGPEVCA